jgi:uncharacterized membrane protein (DUF4010 family)
MLNLLSMSNRLLEHIPHDLLEFILVAVFSLLIGMEQRRHYIANKEETLFGTDRTFTLIGVLGYILYVISPDNLFPFITGGGVVAWLLGIYYFQKIKVQQRFGMTSIVTALITYCLAPLIYLEPHWLVLLIVVCILILTEIKEDLIKFSKKFDTNEFTSLAIFLAFIGVMLPLLPDQPISTEINISPYKFWLAIVVVSGISYFSYLLRKFVFPDTGILLTGVLGGLYSSTATTVILARKSKEEVSGNRVVAAMFLAITMMYLRIFLLAFFFNKDVAIKLLPAFGLLIIVSALIAAYFLKVKKTDTAKKNEKVDIQAHQNPLEFKTAALFGGLFVLFALVTGYVIKQYGDHGVKALSYVVGVTDIDPFIINLFQGKWDISLSVISVAVLNAINSNNALKMIYAITLGDKSLRKEIIISFGILIVAGIVVTLI